MGARTKNHRELVAILDRVFATKSRPEWLKILTGYLPVGPIYDVAQAFASPFMQTVGMVASTPRPAKPEFKMLANPLKIDGKRLPHKERGRAKKRLVGERALADLDAWRAGAVALAAAE